MSITKHICIQGDSFAYDFSCKDIPSFDVNWTGAWAIVDKLEDKTLGITSETFASGSLVRSGDTKKLELRILPAETSLVEVGQYILIVAITNSAIGFSIEVMQDKFTISEQGI